MQQQEDLGAPIGKQWGIYALYKSISMKVTSPNGLAASVASTIGVTWILTITHSLRSLYG